MEPPPARPLQRVVAMMLQVKAQLLQLQPQLQP
jgi:hypothetical protein